MGPPASSRTISQEAFDEIVKENIDDLGMDPTEALQDAIETLTLQGVDLSGIVKCVPGQGSVKDNPMVQTLDQLKEFNSNWRDDENVVEVIDLLDKLSNLCSIEGSGNIAIANKNGGVELVSSICSKIRGVSNRGVISAFNILALLLNDVQSTGTFFKNGGPSMLISILDGASEDLDVLNSGFSVVAAAATSNEIVKESFMELKIDEMITRVLNMPQKRNIPSLYNSVRVLLTPDDNRVVASQVYGYARRFAKIGIAEVLVDSLREGINSPSLVSAATALKTIAVNDEICRSVADNGGIDATLCCICDSGEQGNDVVARACCSLLSKLAGSDANKSAIVEKGGIDKIIKLTSKFSDDPSISQEVMSIIWVLCLRSPENATVAIEAGAGDLAIQAMKRFPGAANMQISACQMIRNLTVRNPENRSILLSNGVEELIRKVKVNHPTIARDAATDALRDLGLDNYNL
ncbi:armadillo repeat-containing protein 6 [Impatiens glandulifera]|uniref:armadillo repeat-containing protein 6 n=1 Tax=Impatiens glandulifera TaxID=253017 RepID=UPI001FB0F60E|nr:armadillo repeat-containing protein 6 [Impatiens glandulifera]